MLIFGTSFFFPYLQSFLCFHQSWLHSLAPCLVRWLPEALGLFFLGYNPVEREMPISGNLKKIIPGLALIGFYLVGLAWLELYVKP